MSLSPHIAGEIAIHSSPDVFWAALRSRVEVGLLNGKSRTRSQYSFEAAEPDRTRIRSEVWTTAINVGLNDVGLRYRAPHTLQYDIRFWQWTMYCVGLSGAIGGIGILMLTFLDVRGYIANNPGAQVPGLTVDQNLAVAWVMALFWGFGWPWIMVALHKRSLHRLIRRIVREVDGQFVTDDP